VSIYFRSYSFRSVCFRSVCFRSVAGNGVNLIYFRSNNFRSVCFRPVYFFRLSCYHRAENIRDDVTDDVHLFPVACDCRVTVELNYVHVIVVFSFWRQIFEIVRNSTYRCCVTIQFLRRENKWENRMIIMRMNLSSLPQLRCSMFQI